jgi:hypothetical protein
MDTNIPAECTVSFYGEEMSNTGKGENYIGQVKGNALISTLKMEAVCSSETLVTTHHTTWCHNSRTTILIIITVKISYITIMMMAVMVTLVDISLRAMDIKTDKLRNTKIKM